MTARKQRTAGAKYYTTPEQRIAARDDALDAIANGYYTADGVKRPFSGSDFRACIYVKAENMKMPETLPGIPHITEYSMVPCDSFEALRYVENPARTAVLNFACASTPGGGFLSGSKAQEECLCRQSTLYGSLTSDSARPYYEDNAACMAPVRKPALLYSPCVYVFRNADLTFKPEPVRTQVVTMAAPNLRGAAKYALMPQVDHYLLTSVRMMSAYLAGKADTLILGAWGCGSFGNDPAHMATIFRRVLWSEGFGHAFRQIIFAIRPGVTKSIKTDKQVSNMNAFTEEFKSWVPALKIPGERKTKAKAKTEPKPKAKAVKATGKKVEKQFHKGDEAYMVHRQEDDTRSWEVSKVGVKSAGQKYVTVQDGRQPVRFIVADKPILKAEKNRRALLVPSQGQADVLKKHLLEDAKKRQAEDEQV